MRDAGEFLQDPLVLPILGKTYTVPPVSASAGLALGGMRLNGTPEGMSDEETWKYALGSAWDDMIADEVPMLLIKRAGMTALVDYMYGERELTEQFWDLGDIPEALAALVAAKEQLDSPQSPSTEEASGTPSPASTSTTPTRPATRRPAKRAGKSRTPTSGSSGR